MSLRTKVAAASAVIFLIGSRLLYWMTYRQDLSTEEGWDLVIGFKQYGPNFVQIMTLIGTLVLLFAVGSAIHDRHRKNT